MSIFTGTAELHHTTPLPADIPFSAAVAQLHNHEFLLHLDPTLSTFEPLPTEDSAPNTKRFKVTDVVHTLPKGLWDSTVTFEARFTNLENGVEWVIHAPLGLVQTTYWKLVKAGDLEKREEAAEGVTDKAEWYLVEDVDIKANKLLVPTVKSQCEKNWKSVHEKFVGSLKEVDAKA